jgi:quercetin dioxygenase-like cupin family protein
MGFRINIAAWVLRWSEDHDTGFHDHDVSAAAVIVLDGQVREDRLRLDGQPTTRIGGAGDSFTVPPSAIHPRASGSGNVGASATEASQGLARSQR